MRHARLIVIFVAAMAMPLVAGTDPYLHAARGAAQWINSSAIRTPDGVVWPSDPRDAKSVNETLYAGTPGPILFFLELYRDTGETRYLKSAREGTDALLRSLKRDAPTGLYEGLAGEGFTLGEAYLITHDKKYLDGALQCVSWLQDRAQKIGNGVEWNDSTDIIAGSSGTGLFLLWAAEKLAAPGARELAISAGESLIEKGRPEGVDKRKWMMDSKYPKEMPNFSHGTAGVAYFLATLYQQTGRKEFLDAALEGARYLLSIADKTGDICLIYHDDTFNGKTLYYLGWCHGPAGTARLFYRLYQTTKDPAWLEWTKKAARAIVASGGPEKAVTPGVWHNVSACCGTTAEAEFFLDVYRVTHDREYLQLSRKATDELLSHATQNAKGTSWVQVETRVKPDVAIAQTGYMQGASGIGMWLLKMSDFSKGKVQPAITFPDNPFAY
ncbi:MAG TPA: lanthionine synthetase LanC family protein [Terriglobales bacterium]|nr:lanthionine synthetase LanC family protein [Terriglobales bacterium]